ncbi:MAG: hypothetical protein ACT4PP_02230 [Sporichthyaceae bacterium]
MPEKVAAAAAEFITGPLLENPHRVGKPLAPPSPQRGQPAEAPTASST